MPVQLPTRPELVVVGPVLEVDLNSVVGSGEITKKVLREKFLKTKTFFFFFFFFFLAFPSAFTLGT